ncbi:hypothetical protein BpHYR1_007720 [Brachionus plicatilis]|uniref:Uncharacterized protein n=1 Tax=Brachionus plicatilis TaxID=10195 RepID=A0A3M7PSD8_BRAPC|nr:hypothetical protein BpHYR1_007720 [Brachionus plicatilis]
MINFFHKPCCPDGENSRSIAKRMKKKAKEYKNELEYLLKTRLDTKATKELKFSEIEDFPRLSKTIIIENIIFGTYQYNQCQSYYEDLLDNETCYLISEKSYESRNNAENTKIIAFEIASRHKRKSNEKPNEPKHVRVERKKKGRFVESISKEVENENDKMNENIFNNVFMNEYQEIPFIEQFKNHVPKWGAKIVYNGISNIILSNTCSIDYFLLSLWCLPILDSTQNLKDILGNYG